MDVQRPDVVVMSFESFDILHCLVTVHFYETGVGPGHSDGPEHGRRVLYIVFLISSPS